MQTYTCTIRACATCCMHGFASECSLSMIDSFRGLLPAGFEQRHPVDVIRCGACMCSAVLRGGQGQWPSAEYHRRLLHVPGWQHVQSARAVFSILLHPGVCMCVYDLCVQHIPPWLARFIPPATPLDPPFVIAFPSRLRTTTSPTWRAGCGASVRAT